MDFEPCSKLEDLNLDVRDVAQDDGDAEEALSARCILIDKINPFNFEY